MLSSKDVPSIVTVKKTTASKSLAAKIFGLAAHIGILTAGTKVAEYAWRFWGACQIVGCRNLAWLIELQMAQMGVRQPEKLNQFRGYQLKLDHPF